MLFFPQPKLPGSGPDAGDNTEKDSSIKNEQAPSKNALYKPQLRARRRKSGIPRRSGRDAGDNNEKDSSMMNEQTLATNVSNHSHLGAGRNRSDIPRGSGVQDLLMSHGGPLVPNIMPELPSALEEGSESASADGTLQPSSEERGTRENLNYLDKLAKFHQEHSRNLNPFPTVNERPLDLYRLRKAIQVRDGFDEVCETEKWAEIGRDLGYSGDTMSSLLTLLKNFYLTWIQPYEEYLRQSEVQQDVEREDENTTFAMDSAPFPRTAGFTDFGYGLYARGKAATQRTKMDTDPNPNPQVPW